MLSNLKSKGLVEEVSFNGRQRILKAVHPKDVAQQTCSIMHGRDAGYCTHITKTIYKESIPKGIPKKVARSTLIFTTDSEHQKLEDKYGKEVRDWCYQHLSEWKEDTPKSKWKKNDYRTILRWVADAYHEEQLKIKKREGFDSGEKNKALAAKIIANFSNVAERKGMRIDFNSYSITFVFLKSQKTPLMLKFSDNGFKEQVDSLMRKYKLI